MSELAAPPACTITELAWDEIAVGGIDLPARRLDMVWGFGSGLTRRPSDPPGIVWAIGDRGPNLKVEVAIRDYGVDTLDAHVMADGAKVMPRLDIGPALAELRVLDDRVELVRIVPLTGSDGRTVSGLPPPGSAHARVEPAIDIAGNRIDPDPSGIDSEGVVALAGGGFVIGDEYGPSLVHVDAAGSVIERWVPEGCGAGFAGARYPVCERLPAVAASRRLNRGFEALAPCGDGRLVLLFQSPLANPEPDTSKQADHLRIWTLDAETGVVDGEWLYALEPVQAFRRDSGAKRGDRKVSEITALDDGAFLVLERVSHSTKLFRIRLEGTGSPPDVSTAPTMEERSADGQELSSVVKELILDTDDHDGIGADLEGVTRLDAHTLLIVNDNDFGCEGAVTRFWRVRFAEPILG